MSWGAIQARPPFFPDGEPGDREFSSFFLLPGGLSTLFRIYILPFTILSVLVCELPLLARRAAHTLPPMAMKLFLFDHEAQKNPHAAINGPLLFETLRFKLGSA